MAVESVFVLLERSPDFESVLVFGSEEKLAGYLGLEAAESELEVPAGAGVDGLVVALNERFGAGRFEVMMKPLL